MHLGIPALLEFYRNNRNEESLVLATIIATEGSTYRKPGAMMLISAAGSFEGMISGGCLEGDLLHHAAKVFASGRAEFVTYDMHAGKDLVWSLGLGCDGVIHLMLQRLDRKDDFGFFRQLDTSQQARCASLLALTTQEVPGLACGAFAMICHQTLQQGASWPSALNPIGVPLLQSGLQAISEPWPEWRVNNITQTCEGSPVDVIQLNIPARTRVLICGAGPDAVPVARALRELDWEAVIVDHRPAFVKAERFPAGCEVTRSRPEKLADTVDLCDLDAVVIMSHHLESDAAYLASLHGLDIPYVGVLGPRARRDRLCAMTEWNGRPVKGPIGLDIGAELPQAIALSVAAEIHADLNHRDGRSLTDKVGQS